ncbi:MAG: hypothetical protein EBZ91_00080 [Gammaproteobacteria bacterium]|nr:hypothetical protein [Gammaproteobacteria bacterium]
MTAPTRPLTALAVKLMALCIATAATATWAQEPLMLVTEAEMQASLAAPEPLFPRFTPEPGAPRILVDAPKLNTSVSSPTTLKLRFEPETGTTIRPETFKVRYGSLRIDITARITGSTTVTEQGFAVDKAALPKGRHTLIVAIEDGVGRLSERQLQFEIL